MSLCCCQTNKGEQLASRPEGPCGTKINRNKNKVVKRGGWEGQHTQYQIWGKGEAGMGKEEHKAHDCCRQRTMETSHYYKLHGKTRYFFSTIKDTRFLPEYGGIGYSDLVGRLYPWSFKSFFELRHQRRTCLSTPRYHVFFNTFRNALT